MAPSFGPFSWARISGSSGMTGPDEALGSVGTTLALPIGLPSQAVRASNRALVVTLRMVPEFAKPAAWGQLLGCDGTGRRYLHDVDATRHTHGGSGRHRLRIGTQDGEAHALGRLAHAARSLGRGALAGAAADPAAAPR